jgi:RpiR family transcriptional regulator, carbohydrate utilization regulator
MDASYRFRRIGLPSALVLDPHMQAVSASRLAPGTVALVISHTGRTPETLDAARLAEAAGAKVIALTSSADTPLTALSAVVLLTAPSESSLGAEAMTSRLAHLALIDALCVSLSLRRSEADIAVAVADAIIAAKRRR